MGDRGMSGPNWPAINPRAIADECSRAHIANVLIDAKLMIFEAVAALELAEAFMSGFEDDCTQDGIDEKLHRIRTTLAKAKGGDA